MGFAGCGEALIDGDELRVPMECGRQSRGIEACSQSLATTIDMAHADMIAAVVVIWGKAGKGGGLLAGDAADLGHANEDGESGPQSDAGNAVDQVEASGEILVLANGRG